MTTEGIGRARWDFAIKVRGTSQWVKGVNYSEETIVGFDGVPNSNDAATFPNEEIAQLVANQLPVAADVYNIGPEGAQ